jgi:aminocarboxymuconate-semialdehyde decarboxylase
VVIDVHGHYVPAIRDPLLAPFFEVREGKDGVRTGFSLGESIGPADEGLTDIHVHIRDMDAGGIDYRLLSIMPLLFHYGHELAPRWASELNDRMEEDIAPHTDRFGILGTLPMGDVAAANRELARIMDKPSFYGVEIASNIAGIELGDASLNPFWEAAQACGAFVLVHPHYIIADARLRQDYLRNLVGNPLDTTLAVFSLWRNGVLERFPNLNICLSHGGGTFAFAAARFDKGHAVRAEFQGIQTKPSEMLEKLYFDTILHDPEVLAFVINRAGISRMLLGTDYPFAMGDLSPLCTIDALDLSREQGDPMLGDTAKNLLGL